MVDFPAAPALAGHVDYRRDAGPTCTLALLEQYVPNQGDLEHRVADLLWRLSDEHFAAGTGDAWCDDPAQLGFSNLVSRLGARVAELHEALAGANGRESVGAAFRPEPTAPTDQQHLRQRLRVAASRTLDALRENGSRLPPAVADSAERLRAADDEIYDLIADWSHDGFGPMRCRIHGDLRLARVLVAEGEPVFIDAGGPFHRPAAERRAKQPPLMDLGTLVFSLYTTVADLRQRMQGEHPDLHPRLTEPLAQWRRDTVQRLLAAHAASSAGSTLLPAEEGQRADIVRVFALARALDALASELVASAQGQAGQLPGRLAVLLDLLEDARVPG